jgi:pimeloyl-ACP methyl ester carboxylesterase
VPARIGRSTAIAFIVAILAACGGPASPTVGPTPAPTSLAADVAIGSGRTLHVVCVGPADSDRPTVVFENGGGAELDTWGAQMAALKLTDRACSYDRAGIGLSPAVDAPRTVQDQVEDLRAVLEELGVTGPIVLVGHSSGGFNVVLYTAAHPDQVLGVVLVDIRPPTLTARLLAELPPEVADEPDAIHSWREALTTFETDSTMNPEDLVIDASTGQVLAAPGFGDRPVAILWSAPDPGVWEGLDADLANRMDAALGAARSEVEALADDPEVAVVDAGHFIHEDAPDVVNDAIRRILDEVGS